MSNTIPARFKQYFWDVEIDKISLIKNTQFIIERLLSQADLVAPKWVLKNFSRSKIVETLKIRNGFDPITANFWALYLKIPRSQIPSLSPENIKNFKRPRTYWPGQD